MRKLLIGFLIALAFFIGVPFAFASQIGTSGNIQSYYTDGLKKGLVGWWTMDASDYVTATTLKDQSGKSAAATAGSGVTKVIGKLGQGVKFDTTTGGKISTLASTNLSQPFTWSLWVKISQTADYNRFAGQANGHNGGGIYIGTGQAVSTVQIVGDAGAASIITGSLSLNQWHHLVIQRTTTAATNDFIAYLDGVYQGIKVSLNPTDTASVFQIGTSIYDSNYYNGPGRQIDDVRIYNRALSLTEIQQLYALGGSKIATSGNTASYYTDGLRNGLAGWWTFDGVDTTNTTALDRSGNNNTSGELGVGVKKATGKIGQALNFSGANSAYFSVSNSSALNVGSGGWSFSTWVRPNATGDIGIYDDYGTVTNNVVQIKISSYKIFSYFRDGSGNVLSTTGNTTMVKNKWYHLLVIKNGTTVNFYLNSVLDKTDSNSSLGAITTSDGTAPNIGFSAGSRFNGALDDVRVYNRALSLTEIRQLYALGGSTVATSGNAASYYTDGLKRGLVGWWTMDGADVNSTQVLDKSSAANIGTKNGGVTATRGKVGQALKFDGNSGYVSVPNKIAVGDLSFSMWFKAVDCTQHHVLNDSSAIVEVFWSFTGSCSMGVTVNGATVIQSGVLSLNTWYYVTATLRGTNLTLYVNGIKVNSGTQTFSTSGTSVLIGKYTTDYFLGSLDDVRIYNRAITNAEITQLYNLGR